ncbi:MAG: cysteine desulfurase family protein [Bdellovibrionales bacterium]|nr:cysteine desulfurase family protein [Bdellovibrionales bacterium]
MEVLKELDRVYLDYNSTAPLADFLGDKVQNWLKYWGNPSATYQKAREARSCVWTAREQLARFIHARPLEVVFTSGGSESNNQAIKGLAEKFRNSSRNKIITSSVEHPSVKSVCEWVRDHYGFQLEVIPVLKSGHLDLEKYEKALDDRTAFVSIMYVNNETGCIFPIQKLAELSHKAGALFHSDAIQALGKIPVDAERLNVDLLSLSGHKFYSLKGAGALYVKKGLSLESLIHGGPQERKRRAGTENVLAICAFGAVAEKGEEVLKQNQEITQWRDQLESIVEKSIQGVRFIGKNHPRVGTCSSIMIDGVFAETVMMNLDLKGYSVSVSSACHSGSIAPSAVLLGMGYSPSEAKCVLRVSFGVGIEWESLKKFADVLKEIVDRLRSLEGQQ